MLLRMQEQEFITVPMSIEDWMRSQYPLFSKDLIPAVTGVIQKNKPVFMTYGNRGMGSTLIMRALLSRLCYEIHCLKDKQQIWGITEPTIALISNEKVYDMPVFAEKIVGELFCASPGLDLGAVRIKFAYESQELIGLNCIAAFAFLLEHTEPMLEGRCLPVLIDQLSQRIQAQETKSKVHICPSIFIDGWIPRGLNMQASSISDLYQGINLNIWS